MVNRNIQVQLSVNKGKMNISNRNKMSVFNLHNKGLIHSFSWSVCFWMIAGGEVKSHFQCFTQCSEELRDEFGSSVRSDMRRYSMFREDMKNEEICKLFGSNSVMGRNENCLFRSTIDNHQDRSISVGRRKLFDEIHGNRIPRTRRNR